jgi:pimeloyl-ACP methyl ester carboxylesterase
MGALALLVSAATVGAMYQAWATARDASTLPPPGRLVDVGGYRLHVVVAGEEHHGPTVVLENGSGSVAAQWGWVQPEVARFARVVAYDRPGQGYSDPAPPGLDASGLAADLREALDQLGVRGPHVMVGHSLGALLARSFAAQRPSEVEGLVLVDPRYRDLDTDLAEISPNEEPGGDGEPLFLRAMPVLARLGLVRLAEPLAEYVDQLPQRGAGEARAALAQPKLWDGIYPDALIGESAAALLERSPTLGGVPLVVLSADQPDMNFDPQARPRFTRMHERMASILSPRGEHVVVRGADHQSIMTDRRHAVEVADAVRSVLSATRSGWRGNASGSPPLDQPESSVGTNIPSQRRES